MSIKITESLLPVGLREKIETGKITPNEVCAVAVLICNVLLRTIQATEKGEYRRIDGNPGDKQCQNRALILRGIFERVQNSQGFRDELTELKKVEKLRNKFQTMVQKRGEGLFSVVQRNEPLELFKKTIAQIGVSQDMEFLMHCHLLQELRRPVKSTPERANPSPNGIVLTETSGPLSLFSKNIEIVGSQMDLINASQSKVSHLTIERLREMTSHFKQELMLDMLSQKNVRLFSPDEKIYPVKSFACAFYTTQAVLLCLLEQNALVCIRSIVPAGERGFLILLRPDQKKGDFDVIEEEEVDPHAPLYVFDMLMKEEDVAGGAPRATRPQAVDTIKRIGFREMVQIGAAHCPPFEATSDLNHVLVKEAREEIEAYRKRPRPFLIHHCAVSSLQDERARC